MDNTESSPIPEVAVQDVQNHEKTPKESFAELRKAKEDAERQAWQARKELELMQKQVHSQQAPQEEDFDFRQLESEEFPDGKKLVKAFSSVNKKLTGYEQKLIEKDIKIQALEFAHQHPDFNSVVTAENIEKYIKTDEDHAEAVQKSSDPLRKVYNLIKKDSRYQADIAVKSPKQVSQEQKKVDEKEGKPKTGSMGVISDAISTAAAVSNSRMSKEQKSAIWKETMEAARR